MCKVCIKCNGIMNYDPYFQADVCSNCGKMEKRISDEIRKRNEERRMLFEASSRIATVVMGK